MIGALNMFRSEAGSFADEDVLAGRAMADVATIGIMQERVVRDSRIHAEQLQRALDSGVVIEQTKGVLAERLGSPAEAFERLRSFARSNRRRITDVSTGIIEHDLIIA